MPSETQLQLAIGLPLRNADALETFLQQLSDPTSPHYHQFLTPEDFAAQFGPAEADYQALIGFLTSNGLTVTATHPNRTIVDLSGRVADIERTFHLHLHTYQHPTRGQFYAPDGDPSVDFDGQILTVGGLDNFAVPQPMNLKSLPLSQVTPLVTGSGPSGLFIGKDFRAAYAPGVTLTGAGQAVGLFELDGFYAQDVAANFKQAGLPAVPVQTVLLDGVSGAPGGGNIEVTLDIMMAAYMAPGLSKVIVYEGSNWNDVLNRMATDNLASQLSSSWAFSPINATTEQIFKQMIAQGQSLFQASGDSGAYHGWIMPPSDDPNVTVVGGTSLTTAGAGGPWQAESTWSGSGGGVSTTYTIPSYQQGMNMAAIKGSTTMRNIPDVALTADIQMFLIINNGQAISVGGTSAAAPLWAGFTALANQQSMATAKHPLGFMNPLLYGIGKGANYVTDLHDITSGNNGYAAISGYDLATGWGSPTGQHLINDLTGAANQPAFGLSASPASLSLQPGASGTATITVTPQNGFNGPVSLAISGLPTGVTASFSSTSTSTTSTLTVKVATTAALGTAALTITGTSGSLTSTASVNLTVAGPPNFTLSAAPASLTVVQTMSGTSLVTVTAQNGFTGNVTLKASGLPTGVTAGFGAGSAANSAVLNLTASASAAPGTSTVTITGTSGSLSHTAAISLTITAPAAGSVPVNPGATYNVYGMVPDGSVFSNGGLDGGGRAYSANLLGASQAIGSFTYYFGPANGPNAVSSKTIALPAGQYSSLKLLATGANGNQPSQRFTITYSDGSTDAFTQGLSDWYTPQSYAGETTAMTLNYRDNSDGTRDGSTFHLYGYSFNLNPAKTAASVTLPNNRNVVVLSIALVKGGALASPSVVNLSSSFDTTGITTDGKSFSGGLDGKGYAYSANLLGTSLNLNGTPFTLGPANAADVVSGSQKTISLPAGKFSGLAVLATGVNGNQTSQTVKVTYSDGTSSSFVQSFSDWFTPQSYPGESNAVTFAHRNTSTGAADNRTFYLYRYSFPLNNGKTVSTVTLPNNANVKVLAVTLAP